MKPLLASLCLFAATINSSLAQPFSQHFPHGQKIIFLIADGADTAVHQMTFDSGFVASNDVSGNGKRLIHFGQRHFFDCPGLGQNFWSDWNWEANSQLEYYRFRDSSDLFSIELFSSKILEIKTGLNIGSTHTFGQHTLILYDRIWYDENGIQDSVLQFYPFKSGNPDLSQPAILFGKSYGWISGGNLVPIQLIGQVDYLGNYNGGIQIPTWQDYFPEETGDVKIWQIKKAIPPDPSYRIGRLDSFISVTRYADSIRVKIREYSLLANWTWQFRYEYEYIILPPKDLIKVLNQGNFSRYWLPVPEFGGHVLHSRLNLDRNSGKMDIDILFKGFSSIEDSCKYHQIADAYELKSYSLQYGLMLKDYLQWGYDTEILIAAKVRSHQFGNLALSHGELVAPVLELFPNPTQTTLQIGGYYPGAQYEIIDLAGATLLSGTLSEKSIAVDGLADGTYILRVLQDDGSTISGKFVKGVN